MSMNFADVTKTKVGAVEKPPLPPVGTYQWLISKLPAVTTSNDDKWDFLSVPLKCQQPLDDVDVDEYAGDLSNLFMEHKFIFNKEDEAEFAKTLFRVRTFFEKHVQCCEETDTIAEMMNNSVGQSVLATIAWKQDKQDPENFFANIGRTAPLDD